MPTYVLDQASQSVALPRGTLFVSARVTGSTSVLRADGAGPTPELINPAPGVYVVPVLSGPTNLRLSPAHEATFTSPTSIALTLEARQAGNPEPHRIQVGSTDVSGLPYRDLVTLTPDGEVTRVQLVAQAREEQMPVLAARSRAFARELLGVDRLTPDAAARLLIALDPSSSARWLATHEGIGAVLEVLMGISRVVSPDDDGLPAVAVAGARTTYVAATPSVDDLVAAAISAVQSRPYEVGFVPAISESGPGVRSARTIVFVLTDAPPADRTRRGVDQGSDVAERAVVLAEPGTGEGLGYPSSAYIEVPHTRETDARTSLSDHTMLRDLTRRIVAACLPPETDPARRPRS